MMKKRSGSIVAGASALTMMTALVASQQAAAHGYLSNPPSRAYACQLGLSKDCGGAQYEPQSVGETFKGFPAGSGGGPLQGPMDGKIASGGSANFSAMDAQSATRWHLTEIKEREVEFTWQYTAAHPATKHEYFITRSGWNPNQPLTRAAFDSVPFCEVDGQNVLPVSGARHACTIPADKSGQHVILAVWTVGDTAAAFYNVADVNILAEPTPCWWATRSRPGALAPMARSPRGGSRSASIRSRKAGPRTGRSNWPSRSTGARSWCVPVSVTKRAGSTRSRGRTRSLPRPRAASSAMSCNWTCRKTPLLNCASRR